MRLEPGLFKRGFAGWPVTLGPKESTPSLEGGPNDSSDHFFVVEEPFQIADTKKANAPAEGTLFVQKVLKVVSANPSDSQSFLDRCQGRR